MLVIISDHVHAGVLDLAVAHVHVLAVAPTHVHALDPEAILDLIARVHVDEPGHVLGLGMKTVNHVLGPNEVKKVKY